MKIKQSANFKIAPLSSFATGEVFKFGGKIWIKGVVTNGVSQNTNLKTGDSHFHSYDLEVISAPNAILLPEGE